MHDKRDTGKVILRYQQMTTETELDAMQSLTVSHPPIP